MPGSDENLIYLVILATEQVPLKKSVQAKSGSSFQATEIV